MAFNRNRIIKGFRTGILWRVIILTLSILLFIYLLIETEYLLSIFFAASAILIVLFNLIRYVEQTNEQLTRFLDSIYYSDFSSTFSTGYKGESFQNLQTAFTKIADKFRKERAERQESIRYLETVVQHVGIGLLSFNKKGNVSLINNSAKRMLDLPVLHNINGLKQVSNELFESVRELKGGHQSLVRFERNGEIVHWSLFASEFIMRGENYKLISLQNISDELDEKEMEAWQNLTQVLAHEIMNSITPIASLADTVNMLLDNNVESHPSKSNELPVSHYSIDPETLEDVKEALKTIHNRSHGLMRFIRSYRDFTQIPEPDIERLSIRDLLNRIRNLMKGEFERQGIETDVIIEPESLALSADPSLIEQVLINLTKNAFRALDNTRNPKITYEASLSSQGHVEIHVRDNGSGIRKELLDKIFIPFYTSTSADGSKSSGIGLSLSRQIMRIHHGTLTVRSSQDEGTIFTLRF